MAAELKLGDSIPAGVTFSYVPYTPENGDITACGIPINYDASKGTPLLPSLPFPSTSTSSFCQHPFYYPAQKLPRTFTPPFPPNIRLRDPEPLYPYTANNSSS